MNDCYLVDLGASYIRFGYLTETVNKPELVVETPKTRVEILDALSNGIIRVIKERHDYITIVISCPGMIDSGGCIKEAYYVDLKGVNIPEYLKGVFGKNTRVLIENDANLQALGQYNNKNLLYIVIGSAVGGAYVSKDGIFKGENGFACELGHIPVVDNKNNVVFLDDVISGLAMSKELGDLWWEKIDMNTSYIKYAAEKLAETIHTLVMIMDPGEVCICGHLCEIDLFISHLKKSYFSNYNNQIVFHFKVDTWKLVNSGGLKLL